MIRKTMIEAQKKNIVYLFIYILGTINANTQLEVNNLNENNIMFSNNNYIFYRYFYERYDFFSVYFLKFVL